MNTSAPPGCGMQRGPMIASVAELATRIAEPSLDAVREIYEIHRISATPLAMSPAAWAATAQVMNLPRKDLENQVLSYIRDRFSGHEAIVNSVRSRRTVSTQAAETADRCKPPARAPRCRWCGEWHVSQTGLWSDLWAAVKSADGRIGTRPNWARQSAISGLAFGDEGMHDLHSLREADFVGLFAAGERYLAEARRSHPRARFCTLFLNGGPKSAGSVEHAHVQIVAREDRHFAFPEQIARRCPPDYWQRLQRAHEQAGLSIGADGCAAWLSLAPVKERDVTVLSQTVAEGARAVFGIWRQLAKSGTRNFSLAAILAPAYVAGAGSPRRFKRWPNVVWRFVDRGDPEVRHADIGTMELFASSVVAADPFVVAGLLKSMPE